MRLSLDARRPDRPGPELSGMSRDRSAGLIAKGVTVIVELNRLIEAVEAHLSDDLDIAALART